MITMVSIIYKQDMETLGDWQLFGGQLQDLSVQASFADLQGQVLQNSWHDDSVGVSLYPKSDVDFLEDPVWQYSANVTNSKDPSSLIIRENSLAYEDDLYDLLSSSPEEAYLPVDDDGAMVNVTSAVDNGFNFIVPSYDSGTGLDAAKFDYGSILLSQQCLIPDVPQNLSGNQKINKQKSHDLINVDEAIRTNSFALEHGDALDSLYYKNHYKSELDSIEYANDSLLDAESVCQILQQLVASNSDPNSSRPVLLVVSPEEVEYVLSGDSPRRLVDDYDSVPVSCSSPVSSISLVPLSEAALSSASVLTTDYSRDCLSVASSSSRTSSSSIPYSVEVRSDRKLKKKEQNKTAALRYRNKKREEKGVVYTEVEILEQKNAELQAKADDLTKEINYLKSLFEEIKRQ